MSVASSEICLVIGGGHAGGRAIEALHARGYAGRIVLVAAEPHLPYERPPLSKELLIDPNPAHFRPIRDADFYMRAGVELILGSAAAELNLGRRRLLLSCGREVEFDKLLLCTGALLRRLKAPGHDLPGVFYLRTIDDSRAIAKRLVAGARVVVIGGGFIGLEVAASARLRGCRVTVLEAADRLMGRAVQVEISAAFLKIHRTHGVDVRLATTVACLHGRNRVEAVELEDGTRLSAELVVVGIGVIPASGLAERADIEVDDGILTDAYCRTSAKDVYACGDVTRHYNPRLSQRVRLESWHNAQNQAIAAARNLCGQPTEYADIPWFWTDQYESNLQIVGLPEDWEDLVFRGDPHAGNASAFKVHDGELVGAVGINRPRDIAVAKRLMAARRPVDPVVLADEAVELRDLLR